MGVKNLWQLLSAAARAIDIKSLEGAVVAVDVSIWMIKILHGMAKSGSA
jgi:DNA excision repair protein ERCC-5